MKSIITRLLPVLLVINITGMILIAGIGNVLSGNTINEQSLGRIGETTKRNATSIDSWLTNQISHTEAIASGLSALPSIDPYSIFPILLSHDHSNEEYFAVYVGYPDGTGVFSDEWEPDYNTWKANERTWYTGAAASPRDVNITDLYVDATTGNICVTFSKAISRNGATAGVVALDIFTNVLLDVVADVDVGRDSYAFLTDSDENIIVHHNNSYSPTTNSAGEIVFTNLANVEKEISAGIRNRDMLDGDSVKLRSADGMMRYYTARTVPTTDWILFTAIPVSVVDAPIQQQIRVAVLVSAAIVIIAAVLIYFSLKTMIVRPIKDVTEAANVLANGQTGVRLDGKYVGEIAQLADSFRRMESFNKQQDEWLQSIAGGDLSIEVIPRSGDDQISGSINRMLKNLNDLCTGINESSYQVTDGSRSITDGSQALSQGSAQQASAISELSDSIAEIAQKTRDNADTAEKAASLSGTIKKNAEKGSQQMDDMMAAVMEINEAGKSINKVIKVIDDIAFQTNILALNAAVEAARAGQHGKGFAVVAEEVRNLAAKSAEAAKETGSLIANSVEKAELGSRIAGETASSLAEIVTGIDESNMLVTNIARSSGEQSDAIDHVNRGIDQVTQIVEQTGATAAVSAAASAEMSNQAAVLSDLVSQFKLRDSKTRPGISGRY